MSEEGCKCDGDIVSLLAEAMQAIGPITKDRACTDRNGKLSYNFRGIDDVYAAVQPVFAKLGIVPTLDEITVLSDTVVEVGQYKTKMRSLLILVKYLFTAKSDGSSKHSWALGEAFDSSDKAAPKAMSCAMKYAMFQTLCIPSGENLDTENETHQRGTAEQPPQQPRQQQPPKSPPSTDGKKLDAQGVAKVHEKLKECDITQEELDARLAEQDKVKNVDSMADLKNKHLQGVLKLIDTMKEEASKSE